LERINELEKKLSERSVVDEEMKIVDLDEKNKKNNKNTAKL
jgi:hypothetical protein